MTIARPLFRRRVFTPTFLVRRWQIEKNRAEHTGELEEGLVTTARLQELRDLVAAAFPDARVNWALSLGALETPSAHWQEIRSVLRDFVEERGDEVIPNPCSGYTVLYNRSAVVEAELLSQCETIGAWLGRPPRSVHAWVLLSRTLARVLEHQDVDAVTGHCFSQWGVDGMSMDGAPAYPYYPSRRHCLIPGRDARDQLPVPMLDAISLDLLTCRGTRKSLMRRHCRMGLQLLETVNWDLVGPAKGLRELEAVARTFLDDNRGNLPFAWITTTQEVHEVFRHPQGAATYRQFFEWLAATFPDLEVTTTASFGRDFRATYPDNTWHYLLHARGTGVGPSDPRLSISYEFCRDYRKVTLVDARRQRPAARLIDYVDYHQDAVEPDGPVADISLRGSPWLKDSVPRRTLLRRIAEKRLTRGSTHHGN